MADYDDDDDDLSEFAQAGHRAYLSALARENVVRDILGFPLAGVNDAHFHDPKNREDRILMHLAMEGMEPQAVRERVAAVGRRRALREFDR